MSNLLYNCTNRNLFNINKTLLLNYFNGLSIFISLKYMIQYKYITIYCTIM
jgi:hypothetical protein